MRTANIITNRLCRTVQYLRFMMNGMAASWMMGRADGYDHAVESVNCGSEFLRLDLTWGKERTFHGLVKNSVGWVTASSATKEVITSTSAFSISLVSPG